jgi:hypothetical protein
LASVIDIDKGAVASEPPDPPPEQADNMMIENKKITKKNNLIGFIKLPPPNLKKLFLHLLVNL